MSGARLDLTRSEILAFRRRALALDARLPFGQRSLRRAAWTGLQDSMPRAALLSIHARVEGTKPTTWEHPSLVQLWGPRFNTYVVAERDIAVFTLGRLSVGGPRRDVAEDLAERIHQHLEGKRLPDGEVGRALGVHPSHLRYAAPTGTVLIRWDGARQPLIWTVPRPEVDPGDARLELARRYLSVLGPATSDSFAKWAGIFDRVGAETFQRLRRSLTPVRTPIGEAWILTRDEPAFRATPEPPGPARLLPSGDAYFLLHGDDRALLVPDGERRKALWTSRVWPGALVVTGEIAGTWRRSSNKLRIETWRTLTPAERGAVEAEAASLPLPEIKGPIVVGWDE